jgi:hypothetical protein
MTVEQSKEIGMSFDERKSLEFGNITWENEVNMGSVLYQKKKFC